MKTQQYELSKVLLESLVSKNSQDLNLVNMLCELHLLTKSFAQIPELLRPLPQPLPPQLLIPLGVSYLKLNLSPSPLL